MRRTVAAVAMTILAGGLVLTQARSQEAVTCFGRDATIVGTEGDDDGDPNPTLFGTAGADVIAGLGGRDYMNGQEGDDYVCGNGGNDIIGDYFGDDHMAGASGNDLFNQSAPAGNDVLIGGAGTDEASYEDKATVNLTTDSATTLGGQDVVTGIENLSAGSGSVVFIGDAGPNVLSGNAGRDRIRGRSGDDVLRGHELKDRLNGGPGEDTCYGHPSFDEITNCEHIITTS
jgi:Ca2+-binding RTX toxin-like protein